MWLDVEKASLDERPVRLEIEQLDWGSEVVELQLAYNDKDLYKLVRFYYHKDIYIQEWVSIHDGIEGWANAKHGSKLRAVTLFDEKPKIRVKLSNSNLAANLQTAIQ